MTVPACPGPGDEQPGRVASVSRAVVGPLAPGADARSKAVEAMRPVSGPLAPGDDARAVPVEAMPSVRGPLAPGACDGDEPTTEMRVHRPFGPGDQQVPRAAVRVTRK